MRGAGLWLAWFLPVAKDGPRLLVPGLALLADTALAQSRVSTATLAPPLAGVLDGLGDLIVGALTELLRLLVSPIETVIENHADALLRLIVSTPHPEVVFGAPTNGAWPAIHSYYWQTIIPIALGLYALAIGLVILLETTSHLFSNYHRTKLKKRAFSGLVGILAWWWIAAFSLEVVDQLAMALTPSLSDISFFETLSFSAMGVLGLVLTLMADLLIFVLIGLVYLTRHLVLYLFVLLMPLLVLIWIPGVGPFSLAAGFARNLAGFYVPFLFMPVPIALLFRVGGLLGQNASFSVTGIGGWITALVVPFAALLSPLVMITQAGQIQSVAGRLSAELSTNRAKIRTRGPAERVNVARERAGYKLSQVGNRNPLESSSGGSVSRRPADSAGRDQMLDRTARSSSKTRMSDLVDERVPEPIEDQGGSIDPHREGGHPGGSAAQSPEHPPNTGRSAGRSGDRQETGNSS